MTNLLLLAQRCISRMENEAYERRGLQFRSSLEGLYTLTDQLLHSKDKSYDEYRSQISTIVETSGALDINDCMLAALGNSGLHSMYKSLAGEYPLLLPLLVQHVKPFRMRYIPYGRHEVSCSDLPLDKMKCIRDADIIGRGETFDCIDLSRSEKEFLLRVDGIDILLKDHGNARWIVISGRVCNLCPDSLHSPWIKERKSSVFKRIIASKRGISKENVERALSLLSLKDYFVFSDVELASRYVHDLRKVQEAIRKPIGHLANEFLTLDKYQQRRQLLNLLLRNDKCEYYYTAYLLYDLLSIENNVQGDTAQQVMLLGSLPWKARLYFKDAMVSTVEYTESLSLGEEANIPLAQQVCLLKASDRIKSKAMNKLREVKAKSEDSGAKARQYLEGLLKIPFGSYRCEEVLTACSRSEVHIADVSTILEGAEYSGPCLELNKGLHGSRQAIECIETSIVPHLTRTRDDCIHSWFCKRPRRCVVERAKSINNLITDTTLKIRTSGSIDQMYQDILRNLSSDDRATLAALQMAGCKLHSNSNIVTQIQNKATDISSCVSEISNYMTKIGATLDVAVHGHTNAKRQVQRIIGQWMTGEPGGYCFGFEGPPGVGKTSLAKKGIAQCLLNNSGEARPFSFIAVGGASNASTLDGHNYTYVGSTWGRVVDTVMEAECLNPIIFIDELDKISNTEHGKEIIGILTHLVDPSQNDCFQDKYFAGIDIDLSKALIVFSYNDASLIDRILLDRIHRVKFDALTLEEKLVICKEYLVPEIVKKMGLPMEAGISDEGLIILITEYTQEAGVRLVKELLFEIFGELNLRVLHGEDSNCNLQLTVDDIKNKFLSNRTPCMETAVLDHDRIGLVNGLWANSFGIGGLLHIQVTNEQSNNKKDTTLKLTGKQGDVMKESADVALSIARRMAKTLGIRAVEGRFHIHVPDAATPKDGPSAGVAITTAIISVLSGKKVRCNIAVTGEVCLRGMVKAVGGLEAKIAGAVRAGASKVLFPKENLPDIQRLTSMGKIDIDVIELQPIVSMEEALKELLVE
jgi:ATP-dependent Lon protease